jgi:hypothetical protein
VLKKIDMGKELDEFGQPDMSGAVRPMALAPDEQFVYFQVSFFHGFVEYDLQNERVTRLANLPLSEEARSKRREEYLLDSAHHGWSMNPSGACVAGTMSDYAAIVDRSSFAYRIAAHGHKPYWATNSKRGSYCFVSFSGDNAVSVISCRKRKEIARIQVGDHPQRMRFGKVRAGWLGTKKAAVAPALAATPPPALALEVALLTETDLVEQQQQRAAEPERDSGDREHLADQTARHGGRDAAERQRRRGSVRDDAGSGPHRPGPVSGRDRRSATRTAASTRSPGRAACDRHRATACASPVRTASQRQPRIAGPRRGSEPSRRRPHARLPCDSCYKHSGVLLGPRASQGSGSYEFPSRCPNYQGSPHAKASSRSHRGRIARIGCASLGGERGSARQLRRNGGGERRWSTRRPCRDCPRFHR